jgi:cold shock CspA family protein
VAPGGALAASVTSSDPAVGQLKITGDSGPSVMVEIPAGLYYSEVVWLDPLGAGQTTVEASIPGFVATQTAVADVAVGAGGIVLPGLPALVGAGLRRGYGYQYVSLGGASHGGVTVHIESSDPAVALVSESATSPGAAAVDIFVPDGQGYAYYTIDGVTEGTATITATASGFTAGGGTVFVVHPALQLSGLPGSLTTQAADYPFSVMVGVPHPTQSYLWEVQNVAPGGGLVATVTNANPAAAQLTTAGGSGQSVMVEIPAGLYYSETVWFDPLGVGETTVEASIPGFITTAAGAADVMVGSSGIAMVGLPATVGAGLQRGYGSQLAALDGSDHGGVTVHIESDDPSVALVALDAATPATPAVDVFLPNGSIYAYYVIEGVAEGTATITATASGFTGGSGTVSVVQPALQLSGLPAATTTQAAAHPFYVYVGVADATLSYLTEYQSVPPGDSVTATVTNSNPAAAQLETAAVSGQGVEVEIPAGQYYSQTVWFDPLGVGETTVEASIPGFITTAAGAADVMVGSSGIAMVGLPATVGAGLQRGYGQQAVYLGGSDHGGVTVHIESGDPSVALVAVDAATPGTPAVDVFVPNGSIYAYYVIEGVAEGTATITATASGFTGGSGTVSVVQPALQLSGLPVATTTQAADHPFYVYVGVADATLSYLTEYQSVPPGDSVTATVTSSDPAVAQLTTDEGSARTVTAEIPAGQYYSEVVAFDPLGVGQTTIASSIPGFLATYAASAAVTVTPSGIAMYGLPAAVGAGLQRSNGAQYVLLDGTDHGGVTVHIESDDPTVALVAADAVNPGTPAVDIFVPNGQGYAYYAIEGVAEGTATITATAGGFTAGSGTVTTVQPALQISGLPAVTTTQAADHPFYVYVGVADPTQSHLAEYQNVPPGGSVTATVTNSNPAVAQLKTADESGQSVEAEIQPGQHYSEVVGFDPLGTGLTKVEASIAGFVTTAAGAVDVIVEPAGITLPGLPASVGAGLQRLYGYQYVLLGGSNHGGVKVHIESDDPTVALLAADAATPGTSAVDIFVPDGLWYAYYVIEGVAEGTATITAAASGFMPGSGTVSVVQPALQISGLPAETTTQAADHPFYVYVGVADPTQSYLMEVQGVAAGGEVTATVTNSSPAVAQLKTADESGQSIETAIQPGQHYSEEVGFDPLSAGPTKVVASIPGFVTTTAGAVDVIVEPAGITLPGLPASVGAGLQRHYGYQYVALDGSAHGGVTVHIQSDDPTVALVSPDPETAAAAAVDIFVPDGIWYAYYVIEGVAEGTATITAAASGFMPGSGTVTVVQPAAALSGLPAVVTTKSPSYPFHVYVGIADATESYLLEVQSVAPGVVVTATVTSSDPAVAQLTTDEGSGASAIVEIPAGQYYSDTVELDPLDVGETTLQATVPGFVATAAATAPVIVVTPGITMLGLPATVGTGLQRLDGYQIARLDGSAHGGVTMHIESEDPSVARVAAGTGAPGAAAVDIFVPDGVSDAYYTIEGVAEGTVEITATASDFTPGQGTVSVVQAGLQLSYIPPETTTRAADHPFVVHVGVPDSSHSYLLEGQSVAPGVGVVATVTNGNPPVAQLTTDDASGQSVLVEVAAGQYSSETVWFDPLAAGVTTVAASIPGFIATAAASTVVSVVEANGEPSCGDEIVEEPETCDPPGLPLGEPDECRDDCTFCGDGVLDAGFEDCDDGNNDDGDDCPADCALGACPFEQDLALGWSMVGAAVQLETAAAGICEDLVAGGGAPVEIDRWYLSAWQGHPCGIPVNDFTLEDGAGYFIRMDGPATWCQEGPEIACPLDLAMAVSWNAVALPRWAAPRSAEEACQEIAAQGGMPVEVDRWYLGGWQGHPCGVPVNDFTLVPGEGYFVRVAGSSTWTIGCAEAAGGGGGSSLSMAVTGATAGERRASLAVPPPGDVGCPEGHPACPPVRIARGPFVANETDVAVTVVWTTGWPSPGRVRLMAPDGSVRIVPDVRGESVVSAVHFVTVGGLEPETDYRIEIEPGGGETLHVRTMPTLGIPESLERWGRLDRVGGDAVVLVRVASERGAESRYLASLASAGYWSVNLGNLRTEDPGAFAAVGADAALDVRVLGPVLRRADREPAGRATRWRHASRRESEGEDVRPRR